MRKSWVTLSLIAGFATGSWVTYRSLQHLPGRVPNQDPPQTVYRADFSESLKERRAAPEKAVVAKNQEAPKGATPSKEKKKKEPPKPVLATLDDAQREKEIKELMSEPFPEGTEISRQDRDDGGVTTLQRLADDSTVSRIYNRMGDLEDEGIILPNGEKIRRQFREDGQMAEFTWLRPDQGMSRVTFSPNGDPMERMERDQNGNAVHAFYGENGQLLEKWLEKADGSRELLESGAAPQPPEGY